MKALFVIGLILFAAVLGSLLPPVNTKAQVVTVPVTYKTDTLADKRKTQSIREILDAETDRNERQTDKLITIKENCANQLLILRRENNILKNKLQESETLIAELMTKEPQEKRTFFQRLFHRKKISAPQTDSIIKQ